ncbi:MAG: translocation/assembly module TamB, partial [Bacteroidales bacterium]|nr:translocation/assembly module TamB [Bacteroidales bacterium]
PIAHDMGLISFSGSFTGFTTDFVAFGTLTTERGSFTTDLSLRPDQKNLFRFNGLLKASDVDLAYVTRNDEMFGGLWLHANIDGSMQSFKHLSANINGVIDSVEINDYLYRNVAVEGKYSDRVWDGNIAVRDENIRMDILGRFDLSDTLPEFDFTMNLANAELDKLNLVAKDTLFRASALLTATFKGNNIDNLDGDLRLINSTLENSNGKLSIYDFLIRSEKDDGVPLLSLRSDFADAEVRGEHTFATLGKAAKSVLAGLFPSKFPMPAATPADEKTKNQFTFNASIKNIDKLNEFFGTGVSIAGGSSLSGYFMGGRSEFRVEFRSDAVEAFGNRLQSLSVLGSVSDGRMNISLLSDTLFLPERSKLANFNLMATTRPDTLDLGITWNNYDGGRTLGEIKATGFYCLNELQRPYLTVNVLPSSLMVNSSPWKISPAQIVMDSTSTTFRDLLVNSETNFIRLDGRLSSSPADRLQLSFEGLNLDFLNNRRKSTRDKQSGSPGMTFGGLMNGSVTVSDAFDKVLFESDINISDFRVNNNLYGIVTILSEWNPQRKVAVINIKNDYQGSKYFDISGSYNPSSQTADITAQTFRMPLNIINPLVSSFASDVRGVGTGKARLYGKLKQLMLEGSVMADDASMKIDFLQTRYSFSDSIRFTRKGIDFRNIRFYDDRRNQGTINGSLTYNSFKNLGINFDINTEKMLVLNTRPKDNDTFYGTAYATGYAGIKGTPDKLEIKISGRTEDNTAFYVPLSSGEVVSEYPYIIMTDPKKKQEAAEPGEDLFIRQKQDSNIELHFDLEVTPEAEVQILIDPKAGDVIRGTGEGKLNITMDSKGDVKMAGNYVIENGDYLFTLGNILNKRFSIEEGGTITWNGGIEDADLNIRAIYRLKASLFDIYPEEEFKERIPVECQLILTEKLMNPVIGFNINLPTANDDVKQYLNMAINTEEELSRQFLYLLVMNSFYPDPALYSASSQSTTQGAAAIGVTTTEMLTNQVSNWLSQISNDFDIGLNYRPGNDITPQEVEVALSTQLLNDKVIVNGNFDVGGKESNANTSTISGDFNVEFKITEKLRFKVFNRANNDIFYETAPYTQGLGIFYRRDFDKFKELFILPDNRKKKVAPAEGEPEER